MVLFALICFELRDGVKLICKRSQKVALSCSAHSDSTHLVQEVVIRGPMLLILSGYACI